MLFDGIRVRVGTGGGQAGTTTQVVEAELRDLLKRLERAFKEEVPPVFAPRVSHPGMHAVPGFIRRAVDKALPQSKNELRTNLRAAVLAELRSVVRDGIV